MLYRKLAVFETSQSWTFPATALPMVEYVACGGGGGGGATTITNGLSCGSGGGGGQYRRGRVNLVPGTTYPITIGGGGLGGTSAAAATAGGGSSIGTVVTARGGFPGSPGTSGVQGGTSGAGGYTQSSSGPVAPQTNGAPGSNNEGTSIPTVSSTGMCIGGQGGLASAQTAKSFLPPYGAGEAGFGTGASGTNAGGDAYAVGCGGGGAGKSTTTTVFNGGNGYRGYIEIAYWDTVP